MRTIKPDNMALFIKTEVLDNKDILSVSAYATFTFDMNEPRLLDEQELWEVANANLAEGEILDSGSPKPRAEYLVYGNCYSSRPVSGIGVHVNVANYAKSIVVMGDRQWNMLGVSEPKEFTSMPLNYNYAFGGSGYELNPVGKGYTANENGVTELPNLEDPNNPITQKSDTPTPVSFTAYPIMAPQRMRFMGKIDDNYVKESWPHLPKGTDPEFFNTAPMDQRLNGFFKGDENFSIKNMHETKPVLNSKLPGRRARIFVLQNNNDDQKLKAGDLPDRDLSKAKETGLWKELTSNAETLWLFPNHEAGVLLYRGSIQVADEEYSDLENLYAVWEDLAEKPKDAQFYYKQMMDEINPPEEVAEAQAEEIKPEEELPPEEPKVEAPAETPTLEPLEVDVELEKAFKELDGFQAKMRDQLKKSGVDPDVAIKQQMDSLKLEMAPPPDITTVNSQMQAQTANLMKKYNLSQDDLNQMLAKIQITPPPPPPIDEAIAKLRKTGNLDPEFEAKLRDLNKMTEEQLKILTPDNTDVKEEAVTEENDIKAKEQEEKTEEVIEEKPVLDAKDSSVEDVIKQYKKNKNLSGMDLSNLDLSKLDLKEATFSDSILENTIFKTTNLDKAIFNNCRLSGVNFTNSSLDSAIFNENFGEEIQFNNASLAAATFNECDFSNCSFKAANLKKACINQTTFASSSFEGVNAEKLIGNEAVFAQCDLSGANFSGATLIESNISGSVINDTNFSKMEAPELRMAGAVGSKPSFRQAKLVKSRADEETVLHYADFKDAEITDAAWEGAQVPDSNFSMAILDDGNFSKCNFNRSNLELATAKNANFSVAQFINSDLNRINLFQGSLRRATLSGANLAYSNLFGVDLYKAKVGETIMTGANVGRTVFAALGIDVDVI